ncbi:hypothetical protein [Spirosoma arcticum]
MPATNSTTFDLSFDHTFRPLQSNPGPPPQQAGCRHEGVYLTWLTLQGGWMYWLFEGSVQRGLNPTSRGKAMQGGVNRSTQKETAPTMVLHTANLTEDEADAVGTIRESISIHLLIHHDDGTVFDVPVEVPDGDAQLWDTQTYTGNFLISITLPSRRSQRL